MKEYKIYSINDPDLDIPKYIDHAIKKNKVYRDYKFTRTPPQDCKI